ncbi:MAG: Asp-tRNA(Asn)/Glu-tRNA(Gln) amidotransferase subunit GatC [Bdellovibrionaceae bacterium]|nr:Asp-tRNA(Asn)/Glu-tRNA(Gln) amidotransferase subunit GatC [Pseudobdellovibrionaceae bacterium]MBX3033702.1 Asp-tRNA(Asn)/Glu-tRNA(Gln) amidotransferase subunit GatC [Pseudobdellovibrionaceae bacterium]
MIDPKTIAHIAKLARLEVSAEEASRYSGDLSKALGYFEQISKVDTQGVEPLVTPSEMQPFWREDEAKREFTAEEMTANAPEKMGNLFKVPPVV